MESRVQKTLLNARVNLIFYFLTLCLSFFSRKIFLDCLGADFVGLTGTLQNLLGFLNLAELGVGSAIGYLLYKPLFDKDHDKINEIISVMGYLYRWIGGIILGAGCVLACFLPLIFPETGFDLALIYFAYFAFLGSSMIGYFINYRQNLLGADQRNYVVTGYYQTMNICKTIIQLALAYYTRNYYLWVLIELSFGIIYSFVLNWKINRTYPWLRTEISRGKELMKVYHVVWIKSRQLFIQRISTIVQYQTVSFLTYAFVNLQTVAFYGNYTIITDKLSQFVMAFLGSSGASVGNLIAEGNKKKIVNLFWEFMSVRYLIGGIITFAIFHLLEPFITIWLGEEYVLSSTILYLICLNMFLNYAQGGVMTFVFGYGLFQDVWAPVCEIIINLGIAIACGSIWGLEGILLGGITSQILIMGIWKPFFLFKEGFLLPVWQYWIRILIISFAILFPAIIITSFIVPLLSLNPYSGYIKWIEFLIIIVSLYSVCAFLLLFLLSPQMRTFVRRFIK